MTRDFSLGPNKAGASLSAARTWLVAALLATTLGCAAQQYIQKGDDLLKAGKFKEAITSYEEALRLSPDNTTAQEGIRKARRAAVRKELRGAKESLSKGDFAEALLQASRARRMPLDLDDVELARRIDETIDQSARGAEERVRGWVEKGQFLAAVDLSSDVVRATPGVSSRQQWADGVRKQAVEHHQRLAAELEKQGLYGSAALQLAMAKHLGAEVGTETVIGLWNRFAEPVCFAQPEVRVSGAATQGTLPAEVTDLISRVGPGAKAALEELRERCGEGTRPLAIEINLDTIGVVDEMRNESRAKALPGYDIKTEEVYYEEIPETVVEDVTEYEVQVQEVERRDCAPRPGQVGCRVWTEKVETKVPVVRKKEVTKIKKVKKTRPVTEPLPADKVVTFEVVKVTRRVSAKGSMAVVGAPRSRKVEIAAASLDESHDAVKHPKVSIPADPLEAKPMDAVLSEAAEQLSQKIKEGVAEAVRDWSEAYLTEAKERTRQGQMPQAEEIYLRMLALGVGTDVGLKGFFTDRYGRSVRRVMDVLSGGMGLVVAQAAVGAGKDGGDDDGAQFPKRLSTKGEAAEDQPVVVEEAAAIKTKQLDADSKVSPGNLTTRKATEGFTHDELADLERESMEAHPAPGASGPVGPSGPLGASGPAPAPGGASGPAPAPAPTGASGPSGASGSTGASGAGGASGPSGASGPTGASGPSGASGPATGSAPPAAPAPESPKPTESEAPRAPLKPKKK